MSKRDSTLRGRSLDAGHLNRRAFVMRAAALGLGAPTVSAMLAACSHGGHSSAPSATPTTASAPSGSSATPSQGLAINLNASPIGTAASPVAATPTGGTSGTTVTLARTIDSSSLDPVSGDAWVIANVYDQLVTVANNGLDLLPALAERWEASSDGLSYTFHVRDGVKFSDGTPLQVSDIIWSLNRAKSSAEDPGNSPLVVVKQLSSPDRSTLVVTLSQTWAPLLADLALMNGSVISQAFGIANTLREACMGTGPFALKE